MLTEEFECRNHNIAITEDWPHHQKSGDVSGYYYLITCVVKKTVCIGLRPTFLVRTANSDLQCVMKCDRSPPCSCPLIVN